MRSRTVLLRRSSPHGRRARRPLLPILAALVLAPSGPALAFQAQALVARYRLDELDGSVAHDSSSNAQDGRFTAGVQLGLPGAAPASGHSARFHPEQRGRALIVAPPGLAHLRSNVSVAAWVRPEADGALMRIFGCRDGGWSCARTAGGLRFSVRYVQDFEAACDVPVGEWTHVAFVFDAGFDATLYVDGQPLPPISGIWPAYAPAPEWSVGSRDGQGEFWEGLLDDVQVYAGDLTPAEVAWLHANPGRALDPMVGTPYCFGDGHSTPCPCANYGDHDGGCTNSTGEGARLRSRGSNGIAADDLRFSADDLPGGEPALLLAGTEATNGGNGTVFGDGLRCVGGAVRRLGVRIADAGGHAAWSDGLRALGGWEAGQSRRFQAWYRDASSGPCGSDFNLTQGVQVSFVP